MAEPFVHETAIVEPDVTLGDDSRVWHHCHIRTGARIGSGCTIGKNVFIDSGVAIGSGVKIQNNVSVYRGVTLADNVFVGPSAVFTNDLFPRAELPSDGFELATTIVHEGASIGANATIVCGNRHIGRYAMVAAGSVVTRDVAPYALVRGNPARLAGYVCDCGRPLVKTTIALERDTIITCGRGHSVTIPKAEFKT